TVAVVGVGAGLAVGRGEPVGLVVLKRGRAHGAVGRRHRPGDPVAVRVIGEGDLGDRPGVVGHDAQVLLADQLVGAVVAVGLPVAGGVLVGGHTVGQVVGECRAVVGRQAVVGVVGEAGGVLRRDLVDGVAAVLEVQELAA